MVMHCLAMSSRNPFVARLVSEGRSIVARSFCFALEDRFCHLNARKIVAAVGFALVRSYQTGRDNLGDDIFK